MKKIFKLPIDAGLDCPNRDGTVAHGGCNLCTVSGSGDAIVTPEAPIREQFYHEIDFMHCKWPGSLEISSGLFSKFYQYPCSAWGYKDRYEQAINEPGVVGINIGTRPDCLMMIDYLQNSQNVCMTVELGLVNDFYEETSE